MDRTPQSYGLPQRHLYIRVTLSFSCLYKLQHKDLPSCPSFGVSSPSGPEPFKALNSTRSLRTWRFLSSLVWCLGPSPWFFGLSVDVFRHCCFIHVLFFGPRILLAPCGLAPGNMMVRGHPSSSTLRAFWQSILRETASSANMVIPSSAAAQDSVAPNSCEDSTRAKVLLSPWGESCELFQAFFVYLSVRVTRYLASGKACKVALKSCPKVLP